MAKQLTTDIRALFSGHVLRCFGIGPGQEFIEESVGMALDDLGQFPINFGYKKAVVTDYAAKPGAVFPDDVMKNDMVCVILTGEYLVKQSGSGAQDHEFTVKAGGVFSCAKDSHESDKNTSSVQAVMRVVDLLPT